MLLCIKTSFFFLLEVFLLFLIHRIGSDDVVFLIFFIYFSLFCALHVHVAYTPGALCGGNERILPWLFQKRVITVNFMVIIRNEKCGHECYREDVSVLKFETFCLLLWSFVCLNAQQPDHLLWFVVYYSASTTLSVFFARFVRVPSPLVGRFPPSGNPP